MKISTYLSIFLLLALLTASCGKTVSGWNSQRAGQLMVESYDGRSLTTSEWQEVANLYSQLLDTALNEMEAFYEADPSNYYENITNIVHNVSPVNSLTFIEFVQYHLQNSQMPEEIKNKIKGIDNHFIASQKPIKQKFLARFKAKAADYPNLVFDPAAYYKERLKTQVEVTEETPVPMPIAPITDTLITEEVYGDTEAYYASPDEEQSEQPSNHYPENKGENRQNNPEPTTPYEKGDEYNNPSQPSEQPEPPSTNNGDVKATVNIEESTTITRHR